MIRPALLLIGIAASSVLFAEQGAGRDSGPAGTGAARTAELSGTVLTDATPAQPLGHAIVAVTGGQEAQAVTDDRGQFTIRGLSAGRYTLKATKPGYVGIAYGAKRYDRPGTTIVLADGQRLGGLNIALGRGSVITGTILDQGGDPAFDVEVRAMQFRSQLGGDRTLGPVQLGSGPASDRTDDQGEYRLYGLPPGDYAIVATPRNLGAGDVRVTTDDEMRAALADMQRGGIGGRGGAVAVPAQTTAATGPAPVTGALAAIYYPGTPSAAALNTVSVGAGEERSGVDVRLQLVRTARVEGHVLTPSGVPPESVQLTMVANSSVGGAAPFSAAGSLLNRATVSADGRFSLAGVAPGQYLVTARTGGGPVVMQFNSAGGETMTFTSAIAVGARGAGAQAPGPAGPPLWGQTDVTVDGRDVTDVVVTLQPGLTFSGRLTFVSGQGRAAPADLSTARVTVTPAAPSGVFSPPQVTVDASGRFTAVGLTPGNYRMSAGLLPGGPAPTANAVWNLSSAMVGGRDAMDVPFEVTASGAPSEAVLTFTDVTQEISGRLQDASGVAAPDYTVVVFPADRGLWGSTRRIKSTRPGTDGRFTLTGLPKGGYRIAALTDMAPNDLTDPTFLEALDRVSLPLALAAGEKKVQDFQIGAGR